MKRFAVIISILLLGIAPVWAVRPEMGTDFIPYDGCPDGGEIFPLHDCGDGLVICEAADIELIYKVFFNKNGDPLSYWERQKLSGGLYELGNPDNFVPYNPLSLTYSYDFVADQATVTGVWALINIPGYGQILHDIGRIVTETGNVFGPRLFEAGEHQYLDGEFDAVCEYMAGD